MYYSFIRIVQLISHTDKITAACRSQLFSKVAGNNYCVQVLQRIRICFLLVYMPVQCVTYLSFCAKIKSLLRHHLKLACWLHVATDCLTVVLLCFSILLLTCYL